MHRGKLKVHIIDSHSYKPISNAEVIIKSHESEDGLKTYSSRLRKYSSLTNSSGDTRVFELEPPTQGYSHNLSDNRPFSVWDIWIKADGFKLCEVKGIEIFPGIISVETCRLTALDTKKSSIDIINVLPNAVFEKYPPKIPELAEKFELKDFEEIYMSKTMSVPRSLVVHNGLPEETTAANYIMEFQEYIKNVACCCMYPTWNEKSLRAGVLCIISFTLNRIFNQHYREKGREYDITSSTAYDQPFAYGRNIYLNISKIVEELYPMYIVKSGEIAPLFIQCCDGRRNEYPGWFSHWQSKLLGEQGKNTEDILKSLLGENIEIYNFNKKSRGLETKMVGGYRSFVPPMPVACSQGWRPEVSYPDDI